MKNLQFLELGLQLVYTEEIKTVDLLFIQIQRVTFMWPI
jgi:hypothetical protein